MHPKPHFSFDIGEKKLYDKYVNKAGYRLYNGKKNAPKRQSRCIFSIYILQHIRLVGNGTTAQIATTVCIHPPMYVNAQIIEMRNCSIVFLQICRFMVRGL